MRKLLGFPNPVNETSARVVAAGVVAQAVAFLAVRQWWVLVPLAYGFVARVLTGPRLSPLGQVATRWVTPRLDLDQGRTRDVAIQFRAAYAALTAEVAGGEAGAEARATLERHAELADRVGTAALERELDAEQADRLEEAVVETERLVRRRRHAEAPDRD